MEGSRHRVQGNPGVGEPTSQPVVGIDEIEYYGAFNKFLECRLSELVIIILFF